MAAPTYICRIAFSSNPFAATPTWTDVSADLMNFHTRRGRQWELNRMEAGTATVRLRNLQGNYWPNNTTGAYYGNILPWKRVNIRATLGETLGYATAGGSSISAVNNIRAVSFSPTFNCTIGSFFVYVAFLLGSTGLKLKGAIYDSALTLIQSTNEITPASLTWNELTLASEVFLEGGKTYWFAIWADVTSGGIDVFYDVGAANQGATDALAYGAWPDPFAPDSYNTNKLSLYAKINYDLYTGYIEDWQPDFILPPIKAPFVDLVCSDAIKNLSQYLLNNAGYASQLSGARIGNVLTSLGWPTTSRNLAAGQSSLISTGALANSNAMTHLFTVQDTELGILFESPDGRIVFQDRHTRLNAPYITSQATFGDQPSTNNYSKILPAYQDLRIYNDIRVTRLGGAEQVATSTTSQDTYGPRSLERPSLLMTTDADALAQAQYLRSRYKDPVLRIKQIEMLPNYNPSVLYPMVFGYDLSTRITAKLTQASLSKDYHIEGINHDYDILDPGGLKTIWMLTDVAAELGWLLGTSALDTEAYLIY